MKKFAISFAVVAISLTITGTAQAVESFSTNVTAGTTGSEEVKKIQKFLKEQGIFTGPINGNYGPATKKAVQDFQKREKIQPTSGDWKVLTRGAANAIVEALEKKKQAPAPTETASTIITSPPLVYPVKPLPKTEFGQHQITDQNVPFVVQAPLGNWSDARQKDGCEEASILMAVSWLRGELMDSINTERQIMAMADFETKRYGFHNDTSAADTARLMKDYFWYTTRVELNVTTDKMVQELVAGRIIILPVNAQKFNNSLYTGAGPERHTIVVTGYDHTSKEFIINDPGITNGWSLRYSDAVMQSALQDYTSGVHLPLPIGKTAMVVVSK